MLETVKATIRTVDAISYEQAFNSYICAVQDEMLENESESLQKLPTLNIYVLSALLRDSYKRIII